MIQIDDEDVWGELLTILQGGAPSSHDGRMGGPIYQPDKSVFKTHHYHPPHGHHTVVSSNGLICEGPAEKDVVLQYMIYLDTYKAYKDPPEFLEEGKNVFCFQ